MQAYTSRFLWRPLSIVVIMCLWPLVLCNGKRMQNILPRPLCIVKLKTRVTLMVSFPPLLNEAHRLEVALHYFAKKFDASSFHDSFYF